MEKQWQDLIEYIENQKDDAKATRKMYLDDSISNNPIFRNHDTIMACCNSRWVQADLTIMKMNRLIPPTKQ